GDGRGEFDTNPAQRRARRQAQHDPALYVADGTRLRLPPARTAVAACRVAPLDAGLVQECTPERCDDPGAAFDRRRGPATGAVWAMEKRHPSGSRAAGFKTSGSLIFMEKGTLRRACL